MKRRPRATGPSVEVVEMCLERAQYQCEINGCDLGDRRGIDWSVQHRVPRGAGGSRDPRLNEPPNLLIVCGSGTTGCHGLIENQLRGPAYEVGWLLRSGLDPAKEKVLIRRERFVLLTADGGYRTVRLEE